VAAYYVVAEVLTNAAKYAHASTVEVHLDTEGHHLNLSIRDDGIGGADVTKDLDLPASATALRRSVASCRSRVNPAWGRHCTPGSHSTLLDRTHSDDAAAGVYARLIRRGVTHGSAIAGVEDRGRGGRWPNANGLPAGVI